MAFNKFKPGTSDATAGAGKTKPRGGWDDDDDDNSQPQIKTGNSGPYKGNQPFQPIMTKDTVKSPLSSSSNKSDDLAFVSSNKKVNPTIEYEICQIDEKFLATHEHENKMINDLIQPGGARVKQSDADLNKFCKACESFQVAVAGSLILSKLFEEIPFVSKARDLFLVEVSAKKLKKYFEFFKHNISILKDMDFSNEAQNATQLNKIRDDIVKYIENPEKPKPVNLMNSNISSTSQSSDILGETDLLGGGTSNKEKQDVFAFIKKSGPESTQSQPFTQSTDLLDMQSSPPQQKQQQPQFVAQNQPQAQPKKFDPFGIGNTQSQTNNQPQSQPQFQAPVQVQSQNDSQAQAKSGPAFKKFQSSGSFAEQSTSNEASQIQVATANLQQNVKETQQTSPLDQLDDLLANFSGLDFSGNKVEPTNPPTQNNPTQVNQYGQTGGQNLQQQNNKQFQQGPSQTNQGFGGQQNPGFSGGLGMQNQQPSYQQNSQGNFSQGQGMGQQMNPSMQFNPQLYPQYGGQGPQGYPQGQWGRGFPPQGYPQQGYIPNPGYGYNQPQYGQGGYPNPQQFGGYQGQPGMYNNANTQGQGQQNPNLSQGQFAMQGKK